MSSPAGGTAEHGAYSFVCIAGPDRGKRVTLTRTEMTIGKDAQANILSDDPEIGATVAVLSFDGARLHVRGLTEPFPFVDGHPVAEAILGGGQQVRLGRSLWEVHAPGTEMSVMGIVNRLGDHISGAAGIEKPAEWNAREMFADVGKKHADEDVENYFTVGTLGTTPPLAAIDAQWPKPWVFARVFTFTAALYLFFVFAWNQFQNDNLIPGLIMVGSVAVPLSLLIFFFEVNVPRNISLYQVIKLVLFGGLTSIFVSLVFFKVTGLSNWLGAASAGIIEESGKALALLLVVNKPRFRWTLNGLLFGATVGTGFAAFETAGYALDAALGDGGAEAMRQTLMERGVLSILGGHVLWTGLVGAALWRVRGDQPFRREMLADPRFVRVLLVCMAMHMVWNSPWHPPMYLKFITLGACAWLLVLGMIQSGLKQVREAQTAATPAAAA